MSARFQVAAAGRRVTGWERLELDHPFLGHALNAVDAKGRVSVPADFRSLIETRCRIYALPNDPVNDKELRLALHEDGDRLMVLDAIASRQLTQDLRESVSELPAAERRKVLREMQSDELGTLTPVSFDSAGRMVLPPMLRDFAGIEDLALFWGVGDQFEIWSPKAARAAFDGSKRKLMTLDYLLKEREARS
jgi:MraZ protein